MIALGQGLANWWIMSFMPFACVLIMAPFRIDHLAHRVENIYCLTPYRKFTGHGIIVTILDLTLFIKTLLLIGNFYHDLCNNPAHQKSNMFHICNFLSYHLIEFHCGNTHKICYHLFFSFCHTQSPFFLFIPGGYGLYNIPIHRNMYIFVYICPYTQPLMYYNLKY